jgi:imidazole glycerol phosphate synthase subunit HisF
MFIILQNCFNCQVRNLGKPVELAEQYYKDGADEVMPLTIWLFSHIL